MSPAGLVLCLVLPFAAEPAPPGTIVLLAGQAAYRDLKSPELVYEGLLQRNAGTGKLGGHFQPYRLACQDGAGKPLLYDLNVPEKAHLLAGLVGQQIRITGKLVPIAIEGKTIQVLWPARLTRTTIPLADRPGGDGIYARSYWQPDEARQRGSRQYVFRDGEQLARALKLTGSASAQTATTLLAKNLGVAEIDWKKHMLVSVCAGLRTEIERLVITKAHVQEDQLTISYKMVAAAAGFGYPAETVLLDRFAGTVRFVEEPVSRPAPRPKP